MHYYKDRGYLKNSKTNEKQHRELMRPILLDALEELFPNERWDVHHKDGDRSNNDIFNLEVMNMKKHVSLHHTGMKMGQRSSVDRKNISKKLIGKYHGTNYNKKNRNPWSKVWRTQISYKGYRTTLGFFNDPISGSLIYDIVWDEIYGGI